MLKRLGGIFIIGVGLLIIFRDYFILAVLIGIILLIMYFLIRFLADLYWWGKDNNRWR